MEIRTILKNYGLNDKETAVYLTLVELGPSPVRTVASHAGVNRGTTYDILKSLKNQGLVSFFDKKTHQFFTAEPPEKLLNALEDKEQQLWDLKKQITNSLPELKTVYEKHGGRPLVKLFEGLKGVKHILEDVLETMDRTDHRTYYVYSSSNLRKNVYQAMPDFSKKRIKKNINVKTVSIGGGGQLVGLDERKRMKVGKTDLKSTYEIIYGGKVAHISLDNAENPVGVIIENQEIHDTQKFIFEFNWSKL